MLLGPLRVLRHRDFALLWSSGLVSDCGTWMQSVALAALVTEMTGQAGWGAAVAALAFLSSGVGTPFGGVLADRHDRRRILLAAALALAAIAVTLAVLFVSGHASPGVFAVAVTLEGLLTALLLPARSAMLPELVDDDEIVDASALGIASWNVGRVLGSMLAGVFVAFASYSWVFVANAISFLGIAFVMLLIRLPPVAHHDDAGVLERLRLGLRRLREDDGCRSAVVVLAFVAFLIAPFIALVPAMAQLAFDGDAIDTARFITVQGVGAVVGGALVSGMQRRFGRNLATVVSLGMLPVAMSLYALAPSEIVAIVLIFVLGTNYVFVFVCLYGVLQVRAPRHLRGRFVSVFFTVLSICYPAGSLLQGMLADVVGIRQAHIAGAAIFLVVMAHLALVRPELLRSIDAARP